MGRNLFCFGREGVELCRKLTKMIQKYISRGCGKTFVLIRKKRTKRKRELKNARFACIIDVGLLGRNRRGWGDETGD